MAQEINHLISELMHSEFGDMGKDILQKQCYEMGVMPNNISWDDLDELSGRIYDAVRYFMGLEKATRVREGIRRYMLLKELWDMDGSPKDDIRYIKECKLRLELGLTNRQALGDMEEAFKYYTSALEMAEEIDRSDLIADSLKGLCFTNIDLGNFDDALELGLKGTVVSEEDGLKDIEAECIRGIGICYWRKGDFKSAFEHLEKSRVIYADLGDVAQKANVYRNLGDIHGEFKKYDKSLEYYQKSMDAYGDEDNHMERAVIMMNTGVVYSIMKDWNQAEKYYLKSEEIAREHRLPNVLAWVLFNKGQACTHLGKFDSAEEALGESISLFATQQDRLGEAGVNIRYGHLFVEKGEFEKGIVHFKEGIVVLREMKMKKYLADYLHELAKTEAQIGDTISAEEHYRESIEIYGEMGLDDNVEKVEKDLANLPNH